MATIRALGQNPAARRENPPSARATRSAGSATAG